MAAQRPEDRLAIAFEPRRLAHVLGRKAAAEIDHGERDAALGAGPEDRRGRGERTVPGLYVVLLRADMEGDAVGDQAAPMRELKNVRREFRLAAELARQRPFRAGAIAMDAADHAATWGGARDLLDFSLAIDSEQAHTEPEGRGDLALFFYRVAIG